MLKALRIPSQLLRSFSNIQPLTAKPKKLQKILHVDRSIRWMHKDVKLSKKTPPRTLSEKELEVLAHRAVSSTLGNSTIDCLQNFCTEFVNRLGSEKFQSFIMKHELVLSKLIYLPHYKAYFKSCEKILKNDMYLLELLSHCDFRQLNTDSIPKLIQEENFDSEHQIEHRSRYYIDMMPRPRWVFDDYLNAIDPVPMQTTQFTPVYLSESDIPNSENDSENKTIRSLKSVNQKPVIDRIITFTQKRNNRIEPSNWIYLQVDMGRDEMLGEELITKTLNSIGVTSVLNSKLFHNIPPVKDEDLDLDTALQSIDITIAEDIDVPKVSELAKSSRKSVLKNPGIEDEALTGGLSTNSSELDKDSKRINEVIKFASRANPKNKAYGFVELESFKSKQSTLNVYFRLFGIEMAKALLVIEDADIKTTLRVSNLPWNLDPSRFVDWINNLASQSQLPMEFNVDTQFKNYLSDASYIFITMNSFKEALQMFEIINKHEYAGRKVYAEFRRGCGRFISGEIVENHHSASREEREKAHIDRRTKQKEAWAKRHSD